ncbi:MAG: Xaa-Pro peptidase family protein [Devosiaceae bacterium]|nr:Xaa-Pro peptidase family protein [Devosiaceae bacterium]
MDDKIQKQRLQKLRDTMRKTNTDLVAVGPGAHMQYLLGFHPHADERPCLLLIALSGEVFLIPSINAQGSRTKTDVAFQIWGDDEGPNTALKNALLSINADEAKNIVLDETMRADFALLLLEYLPKTKHRFTLDTLGAARMLKGEDEIALLKENALIADRAMLAGFEAIKPGMREIEIYEVIKNQFSSEGAPIEFGIVGGGPNGAFPHHQTGERIIQNGDAVVVDIGGRKNGYPSDITRMAIIGTAPDGYEEVHAIVEAAVVAAMQTARPGVRASEVDAAARNVISDAGFGEFFVHRTGHGMGIDIHEHPYITATSETILQSGMVFSIEPGIYLPGRFGIRLEEIVVLRDDGPEVFSQLPRTAYLVNG